MQRITRRRMVAIWAAASGAMMIPGCFAVAGGPSIRLRPDEGVPGDSITVRGRNFDAGATGEIAWDGHAAEPVAFEADADGDFEVPITVPDVAPGEWFVVATSDEIVSEDEFEVEAAPTAIPIASPPASVSETTPIAVSPVAAPEPVREVAVANAVDFSAALADATPGDRITLADGEYTGNFVLEAEGEERAWIVVRGSRKAVINGGDWGASGYALYLKGAYLGVEGITVTNAQKGVMVDGSHHVVIDAVEVHSIGHEAIHLRTHTTDSMVTGCDVHDTGLDNEKFGEGVYIGSAVSNWEKYTAGEPDQSHRNHVVGNRIWRTSSECIDVKEGTEDGLIEGNVFDGTLMTGADSWVDMKGSGYVVRDNHGTNSPEDGFQTHVIDNLGWGRDNVFTGNRADVNGSGYGFYIHQPDETANVVSCDNEVTGADSGLTNLPGGCMTT